METVCRIFRDLNTPSSWNGVSTQAKLRCPAALQPNHPHYFLSLAFQPFAFGLSWRTALCVMTMTAACETTPLLDPSKVKFPRVPSFSTCSVIAFSVMNLYIRNEGPYVASTQHVIAEIPAPSNITTWTKHAEPLALQGVLTAHGLRNHRELAPLVIMFS